MEFDLCVETLPKVNQLNKYGSYHASGRAALYSILLSLKNRNIKRILLPDYLCFTIVTTVVSSRLEYDFYRLNESLLPDIENIRSKVDESTAILIINYFGMQDLSSSVSAIKKLSEKLPVIVDDVQALYSYLTSELSDIDYSFTSLRKWLPVPDGGLMQSKNNEITTPDSVNSFWVKKLNGLALKSMREDLKDMDEVYLRMLEEGENMIDQFLRARGSEVTEMVFERTDLEAVASKRRRNASIILSGLNDIGIEPIIAPRHDSVPFFIPIVLGNRDIVRKKLFSQSIFCPVHWPLEGLKLERGAFMAAHELSIIIDQRYSIDDMRRILSVLDQIA